MAFAFGLGVLCTMFSSTASAQQGWNKKTMVTFSAPVEIPGISAQVLPAGTYVFRLMDSAADRHIVQILNQDESHLFANILAIPNYRLRPTDETVMTFVERKAGDPQAIRAWFYPGDNSGQEFVYPKMRAVELAKIANLPVLYLPEEVAPNIVAPVTTPTEAPVIALREAPVKAVTPAGVDIPIAEVVVTPPAETAAVLPQTAPQRTAQPTTQTPSQATPQTEQTAAVLPKTASSLPFLALMGFVCLGVGVSLRKLCAR